MTLSNENIFRVTGLLREEFTGPRWTPRTKASDAELWRFFDLCLNKWLSKQSWGWWFETLSHPLWRHSNVRSFFHYYRCHQRFEYIRYFVHCMSVHFLINVIVVILISDVCWSSVRAILYGSGHGTAAVLLPGFAINWQQNQVTRKPQFCDLTHIIYTLACVVEFYVHHINRLGIFVSVDKIIYAVFLLIKFVPNFIISISGWIIIIQFCLNFLIV